MLSATIKYFTIFILLFIIISVLFEHIYKNRYITYGICVNKNCISKELIFQSEYNYIKYSSEELNIKIDKSFQQLALRYAIFKHIEFLLIDNIATRNHIYISTKQNKEDVEYLKKTVGDDKLYSSLYNNGYSYNDIDKVVRETKIISKLMHKNSNIDGTNINSFEEYSRNLINTELNKSHIFINPLFQSYNLSVI